MGSAHAAAQGKGLLEPEGVSRTFADRRLVDGSEEGCLCSWQGAAPRLSIVMHCQAHMGRAACTRDTQLQSDLTAGLEMNCCHELRWGRIQPGARGLTPNDNAYARPSIRHDVAWQKHLHDGRCNLQHDGM